MKKIFLWKGFKNQFVDKRIDTDIFALVDDEDYDYLMQWKWKLQHKDHTDYVMRNTRINGKMINYLMHREKMKPTEDKWVDHIDGNGLNNRRSNLRFCTQLENSRNKKVQRNSVSKIQRSSICKKRWKMDS